jgi:hypothetical protein
LSKVEEPKEKIIEEIIGTAKKKEENNDNEVSQIENFYLMFVIIEDVV